MPETQIIPTQTTLSIVGNVISIFTQYIGEELPYIISTFISNTAGSFNGVSYTEGELLVEMKTVKYPSQIDCWIDMNGNLIVKSEGGDTSNYSIDSNGNLIWSE